MHVELRNSYGATVDRDFEIADEAAYGLRAGDEFSCSSGPCYVVVRKHFWFGSDLASSLTLFVKEREDY
jgi:hypothetical protein